MVKELSGHRISDGSALRASNDLSQVTSILVNRHANIGDVMRFTSKLVIAQNSLNNKSHRKKLY